MPCYEIDGIVPAVDPTAFVHPQAVLIGDVIVGAGCYVAPTASLRGDFGRIILEAGANVQDGCVLHGFPGTDTLIGANASVGHGAVVHGAKVLAGALVGMNAVVMDDAVVGEAAIVAACAFVKAGMEVPPRTLVAGIPARLVRELTDQETAWKADGAGSYRDLAIRSLRSLREAVPLAAPEPDRKRIVMPGMQTLAQSRKAGGKPA